MDTSTLVTHPESSSTGNAGGTYAMPATPLQLRLWNLERVAGPIPAWNVAVRFRLSGKLDREILERALQSLTRRHEVLRTSFGLHKDSVVQKIAPRETLPVEWCDLRSLTGAEQEAEVHRLSLEHARMPLPINHAPLLRVRVLRLQDEEHWLLWNVHHAICDGWSVGLLSRDLMECYDALLAGQPLQEKDGLEYGDYAVWLEAQRQSPEYEAHGQYWKRQLRRAALPELPIEWKNAAQTTAASEIHSVVLPRALTDHLSGLAQKNGATFFHAVLAAFSIWMRLQQRSGEVTVGTAFSGRDQAELENVVGTFAHYLPMSVHVEGKQTFLDTLREVRDRVTEGMEHAAFRGEDLPRLLSPAAADLATQHELFSVALICQQDFVRPLTKGSLTLTAIPSVSPGALRPLTVFLVERAEGWRLSCEVDNRQVSSAAGRAVLEGFTQTLHLAETHAEEPVMLLASRLGGTLPAVDTVRSGEKFSINASAPASRRIPATEFQRRFWNLDGMNPGGAAFHIRVRMELKGSLNVEALRRAMERLMYRHEILRTTLEESEGRVWQVIHPALPVDFQLLQASADAAANNALLEQEGRTHFSLTQGPLFRTRVLRLEEHRHWLAITLSHGIADGWTTGLFLQQLQQVYEACLQDCDVDDSAPALQFSDNAEIEQQILGGPEKERRLEWWRRTLQGVWSPLELPHDLTSSAAEGEAPAGLEIMPLPAAALAAVRQFARESQTTVFAVFGAAFQALLLRYSGQKDVLFLTPYANRSSDTESILGPMADSLCLTGHVDEQTTFHDLVQRFSQQSLEAMENVLPLNLITPLVDMRVSNGYHPLSQIVFFYQRAFVHEMEWKNLRVRPLPDAPSVTESEWQLGVVERDGGVVLEFLYDATLYSKNAIQNAGKTFGQLLTHALAEPNKALAQLEVAMPEVHRVTASAPVPTLKGETAAEKTTVPARAASAEEQDLIRIWRQLFKLEEIDANSNFFDLGGHSLLLARMQIALKKQWNVQLTAAEVFRHPTVAELGVWLKRAKVEASSEKESATWMRNSRIVPIQTAGAGKPLFVISQSMIFRTFTKELGPEQPVYAIQMLEEDEERLGSMTYEELIQFYVGLIRQVQPHGPYRVAGWCVSGWVAYGVARELESLGESMELLMVVDSWAPGYWRDQPKLRRMLMLTMYNLQRSRWAAKQKSGVETQEEGVLPHGIKVVARKVLARLQPKRQPVTAAEAEEARHSAELQQIAQKASTTGALQGRLILFRSEQEPVGSLLSADMGWAALIHRAIEVEELPGDHHQIFELPGARMMAASVRAALGLEAASAGMAKMAGGAVNVKSTQMVERSASA